MAARARNITLGEKEEFRNIRFSLDDDMLDSNDERLRTEHRERQGVEPAGPLHDAEGYHQRRLKEAAGKSAFDWV